MGTGNIKRLPTPVDKNRDVLAEVMPLFASGVFEDEFLKPDFNEPISGSELEKILEKISSNKKINQNSYNLESWEGRSSLDFLDLSQILLGFFGWQEKAEHFILESEVKYLLQNSPNFKELEEKS
jgi:hypothetical protein